MSTEPLSWVPTQAFVEKRPGDLAEGDPITAIEFDDSGDYIACGDKGGRIVIYQRSNSDLKYGVPEYKRYYDFVSHEPEFDYLKSLEIEEKINKIKWCKRQNSGLLLLSTNDKTIKLWKIQEKKAKIISTDVNGGIYGPGRPVLKVPKVTKGDTIVHSVPRRVFANAHAYHVNSISLNSDGETYISSDDLRVNMWNLNYSDQSFNIVDIKPANMEDLTEVITSAEFHPHHCSIFMYSSSRGSVKLSDMRASALCDHHAKVFEEEEDPGSKSFFSEIIASISDVKFSRDGRYILSRDYMTLKIWDLNMENKPVKIVNIHEPLRAKLCDLYENDCIFDKFECSFSHDGNHMVTGSYNDFFHVYDRNGRTDVWLEASKAPKNKKTASSKGKSLVSRMKKGKSGDEPCLDNLDYARKVLHVAWHPTQNFVAVSAQNSLYLYSGS